MPVRPDPTQSLLHIQQTEIVLTPLADDDAPRLQRRVRIQAVQFLIDLMLQVPCIGRKPDRRLILLRPQACRRDITERLADARSSFR